MANPVLALAQINNIVGDINHNTQTILEHIHAAKKQSVDIIVFPELTLTGYPPEDLLCRPALFKDLDLAISTILPSTKDITAIIGLPIQTNDGLMNAAIVLQNGEHTVTAYKQHLPNYTVFDEKRYFQHGNAPCIFERNNTLYGLCICEDIWHNDVAAALQHAGAQQLIVINASPFHTTKAEERAETIRTRAQETGLPIAYVNWAGAQDELIFDGGSFFTDANGDITTQAPFFRPALLLSNSRHIAPPPNPLAAIYDALVLGLKDYVRKNGFRQILLGLSGGIDSALTAVIAVDALGAENVHGVLMPSEFTANISNEDAMLEATALSIQTTTLPIHDLFEEYLSALSTSFTGYEKDLTEENIQARIRGTLLMALSNKFGALVLSTSNKSELAIGYSTLYGDMCGGFAVLKDVAKTQVYQLCEWRDPSHTIIPERVLTRPPSAELSHDQTDQDHLPSYDVIDNIIALYVEQNCSIDELIQTHTINKDDVMNIVRRIKMNEYKRSQAPIGSRITNRAFGKDRRYPITHGFL